MTLMPACLLRPTLMDWEITCSILMILRFFYYYYYGDDFKIFFILMMMILIVYWLLIGMPVRLLGIHP